eukprot:11035842-Lingulodinium_polyedra.AAC.1
MVWACSDQLAMMRGRSLSGGCACGGHVEYGIPVSNVSYTPGDVCITCYYALCHVHKCTR